MLALSFSIDSQNLFIAVSLLHLRNTLESKEDDWGEVKTKWLEKM